MVCKKCGAELAEGTLICEQCGQIQDAQIPVVEAPVAEVPAEQAFTLNTEGKLPEKKRARKSVKNKKLMTRIIAGAVALAVLVTCLLGFLVFDWGKVVGNLFNQLKSPEAYSKSVESAALESEAPMNELGIIRKGLVDYYSMLKKNQDMGGSEGFVRLEIGEELNGMLQAMVPAAASDLVEILESLEITLDADLDDSNMGMTMGLKLNDTELAQVEMIMNMVSGMMYMGLPGLSEEYIAMDMVRLGGMDMGMLTDAMEQAAILAEELPSEKEFAQMVDTFILKAMAELDDVDKETRTVTAGGVQQSVTVLKCQISQKTVKNIAIAVLKEAKKNDTLHELVAAYSKYMAEMDTGIEAIDKDSLVEMIDYALEGMEEMEATKDKLATLETYVNSKGEICGRSLKMKNVDNSVTYLTTASGSKVGFKLEVKSEDQTMSLSGSGTKKGDKLSGTYTLKVEDQKLVVLELKDHNSLDGTGTYTLKLGKDALDLLESTMSDMPLGSLVDLSELEIELTVKKDALELAVVLDSDVLVSLSVGGKAKKASTVTIPDKAVNMDDSLAMQQWISKLDSEKLMERLEDAGLSEDVLMSLMGSLMG